MGEECGLTPAPSFTPSKFNYLAHFFPLFPCKPCAKCFLCNNYAKGFHVSPANGVPKVFTFPLQTVCQRFSRFPCNICAKGLHAPPANGVPIICPSLVSFLQGGNLVSFLQGGNLGTLASILQGIIISSCFPCKRCATIMPTLAPFLHKCVGTILAMRIFQKNY